MTIKEVHEPTSEPVGVAGLAFPNDQDIPAESPQGADVFAVAEAGGGPLGLPELVLYY